MELDFSFSSGETAQEAGASPKVPGMIKTSEAEICLVKKHLQSVQNLRPGMKVTITLKGVIEEVSQKAGDGSEGTSAELKLLVNEFSASRGGVFEDLLDE